MKTLGDNTPMQPGLDFHPSEEREVKLNYIPHPVTGQIVALYAPEDSKNNPGEDWLADVLCTNNGMFLKKVPFGVEKSSVDSYVSTTPVAVTGNVAKGGLPTPFSALKIDPSKCNGDTVLVQFIDGNVATPIITRFLPHKQSGQNGVCPSPRPKKSDGDSFKVRIGGIDLVMDKEGVRFEQTGQYGELNPLIAKNLKFDKKFSVLLKSSLPTALSQQIEILCDNSSGSPVLKLEVTNALGNKQTFTLDGTETLTLGSTNAAGEHTITMSPTGFTITAEGATDSHSIAMTPTGMVISSENASGSHEIALGTASGKWTSTIGGVANAIELTPSEAKINSGAPTVSIANATGAKLKLNTTKVGLGSGVGEVVDLLAQTADKLLTTVTKLSTTMGNMGYPLSTAGDFAALIPEVTLIKTTIGLIKGGI